MIKLVSYYIIVRDVFVLFICIICL